MIEESNCDWCQQRLEEFALDELAAAERAQVASHLESGCVECNARLAELVETFALMAHSLSPSEPPARIERELMSRIAASTRETDAVDRPNPPARSRKLLVAAVALAAGLAGVAFWANRTRQDPTTEIGWAEMEQRIRAAQQAQQLNLGPELKFVSRENGTISTLDVVGLVVKDRLAHQCHVYIQYLTPQDADREYRLSYVLEDGSSLPAGSVRPDDDGSCSVLLDLPDAAADVIAVAISLESASAPNTNVPSE